MEEICHAKNYGLLDFQSRSACLAVGHNDTCVLPYFHVKDKKEQYIKSCIFVSKNPKAVHLYYLYPEDKQKNKQQ